MSGFYIWKREAEQDWAWQFKRHAEEKPFGGHATRQEALLEAAEEFCIDQAPPAENKQALPPL